MTEPPVVPPSTRSSDTSATTTRRLPRLEDFPETGPNALATFPQRGWARVVDEAIITLPLAFGLAVVAAAAMPEGTTPEQAATQVEVPWALLAAGIVVKIVYEVVGVALFGQTAGKWLFGIRVARYTDGGRPTWPQSALRCLVWAVPAAAAFAILRIPLFGAAIVFFSAWSRPLRRGWHDDAGGSVVVRTR
jgi:uncharacterized RDD family membrane protein YckC